MAATQRPGSKSESNLLRVCSEHGSVNVEQRHGSGAGPLQGQFMSRTPEFYTLLRGGNVIPARVFKSQTERQTDGQTGSSFSTRGCAATPPCGGGSGDYTL
ncbi:hypothetical protein EYF80_028570 [Liparis tanakae]|uniref:Uncharacterized protein n=1 Tax=Liparis tanakae TaxID=230148 RepID=A0A4Z2H7H4_9TELE|nr:hypothetical protein EYF80_028570 [Liparis tanakae]